MYKKAWCTCRVVVLLIKPIFFFFWRSRHRPRRWILKSLITFSVQQPAIPEGPKRVRLLQFSRKAIPKNCSRGTETIFHKVLKGKRNSEFAVGVSQRVRGDITTIASFLVTFLDLYVKFPGTPETINESLPFKSIFNVIN